MKNITIVGLTCQIICFQSIRLTLRGKETARISVDEDQMREINSIKNAGLIKVAGETKEDNKSNKDNPSKERVSAAEAKTNELNSRVVINNGGNIKEGKMTKSVVNDVFNNENPKVEESLKAAEKLAKEEKEEEIINLANDGNVDESKFDLNEKMGGQAVVVKEGETELVDMQNSNVPGSKEIKERDPFIEHKDETKDKPKSKSKPKGKKRGRKPKSKSKAKPVVRTDESASVEFENDDDAFITV